MGDIPLRIQLLGGFAVSLAGRPVPERAWRLRKAKSLINLLALASGHRALGASWRSCCGRGARRHRLPTTATRRCMRRGARWRRAAPMEPRP
jgi:hypothetical protein